MTSRRWALAVALVCCLLVGSRPSVNTGYRYWHVQVRPVVGPWCWVCVLFHVRPGSQDWSVTFISHRDEFTSPYSTELR